MFNFKVNRSHSYIKKAPHFFIVYIKQMTLIQQDFNSNI